MATSCEGAKEQLIIRLFLIGKKPSVAWLVGCTGQVRAFRRTFGILASTADSASGSFIRQVPPLPVTPAVKQGFFGCVRIQVQSCFSHALAPNLAQLECWR